MLKRRIWLLSALVLGIAPSADAQQKPRVYLIEAVPKGGDNDKFDIEVQSGVLVEELKKTLDDRQKKEMELIGKTGATSVCPKKKETLCDRVRLKLTPSGDGQERIYPVTIATATAQADANHPDQKPWTCSKSETDQKCWETALSVAAAKVINHHNKAHPAQAADLLDVPSPR